MLQYPPLYPMFNVPCACELDFLYQYQNTSQAVDFDIASSQSAGFWVLQMSYIPHNKRAAPAAAAAPAVQLQTLMCLHKWQNAHDLIIQNPQVLTIGSPLHNAFVSAQSIGDGTCFRGFRIHRSAHILYFEFAWFRLFFSCHVMFQCRRS